MLAVQAADDAAVGALEHLDDLARRPAALVDAGRRAPRAVAVQHLAHLGGGEEHARLAVVGHEEAVAVGMAFHPAGEFAERWRRRPHHIAAATAASLRLSFL